jgi:predicted DNA-binding transcriptional regulator AlpA
MTEAQHEAAATKALGKAAPDGAPDDKQHTTRRTVVTATTDGQRFLTYRDVAAITSFHISTVYRRVADPVGDFPQPVRLSENRVGFREAEIAAWMASRAEYRPAKHPAKPRLGSSPLRQLAGGDRAAQPALGKEVR